MTEKKELMKRNSMENVSAVTGAGLGVGTASAIGTAVGSTGVLGSIGSFFGLTVAATTPVGWLIGGALAGGIAFKYGSKLIGGKGYSDGQIGESNRRLEEQDEKRFHEIRKRLSKSDIEIAKNLWREIEEHEAAPSEVIQEITKGLEQGAIPSNEAIDLACSTLGYESSEYLSSDEVTIEELNIIIMSAIFMSMIDGDVSDEEIETLYGVLSEIYGLDEDDSEFIIDYSWNRIQQTEEAIGEFIDPLMFSLTVASIFGKNEHLQVQLLDFLKYIAEADDEIDEMEELYFNFTLQAFEMADSMEKYQECLADFPDDDIVLFSRDSDVFHKKVNNAVKAYAAGLQPEFVYGLYDHTIFGKASKGFIVTTLCVISHEYDIVFYDELKEAKMEKVDGVNTLVLYDDEGEPKFFNVDDHNAINLLVKFFNKIAKLNE